MAASTQPPPMPDDPTDTAADRVRRSRRGGVWIARFRTAPSAHAFANELDALRYALSEEGTGKEVIWVPYGENVFTYQPPREQRPTAYRGAPPAEDGA